MVAGCAELTVATALFALLSETQRTLGMISDYLEKDTGYTKF